MESEVCAVGLRNRSYIYDSEFLNNQFYAPAQPIISVMRLSGAQPGRQWLVVFALNDGWERRRLISFSIPCTNSTTAFSRMPSGCSSSGRWRSEEPAAPEIAQTERLRYCRLQPAGGAGWWRLVRLF